MVLRGLQGRSTRVVQSIILLHYTHRMKCNCLSVQSPWQRYHVSLILAPVEPLKLPWLNTSFSLILPSSCKSFLLCSHSECSSSFPYDVNLPRALILAHRTFTLPSTTKARGFSDSCNSQPSATSLRTLDERCYLVGGAPTRCRIYSSQRAFARLSFSRGTVSDTPVRAVSYPGNPDCTLFHSNRHIGKYN